MERRSRPVAFIDVRLLPHQKRGVLGEKDEAGEQDDEDEREGERHAERGEARSKCRSHHLEPDEVPADLGDAGDTGEAGVLLDAEVDVGDAEDPEENTKITIPSNVFMQKMIRKENND